MDINKYIDFKHKLPNAETYGQPWIDVMDKTIVDGKAVIIITTYRVDRSIEQDAYLGENGIANIKTKITYKWLPSEQRISQSFGSSWEFPGVNHKDGGVFGE